MRCELIRLRLNFYFFRELKKTQKSLQLNCHFTVFLLVNQIYFYKFEIKTYFLIVRFFNFETIIFQILKMKIWREILKYRDAKISLIYW